MPTRFSLDHSPAGISLTSALPNEDVLVSTQAYLSTEDGSEFISQAEAVWGYFAEPLQPKGISPSQVDHLLALVDASNHVTVFCNELQMRLSIRSKAAVKAGQPIYKSDIAGIEELEFMDAAGVRIDVPHDCGVILVLSVGWRKCLYYDFDPFCPGRPARTLKFSKLCGSFYRNLMFQELYRIGDDQWTAMFNWGWFPFIWMAPDDREKVIHFSAREAEPRSVFETICDTFRSRLTERIASWRRLPLLDEQSAFIESAAHHYLAGDYLSAIQVLFPRIEGIMRKCHLLKSPGNKAGQKSMADTLVSDHEESSLLLPMRFRDYLLQFYFRAFDEETSSFPLSRNTVSHGLSLPGDYDFVKASLGFMICDQFFYFLLPMAGPESP